MDSGIDLHKWISDLFPLSRSVVGPGYDESLDYLRNKMMNKGRILSFPTGSELNGWIVPNSWKLNRAQIRDMNGATIIDTQNSNLHIWSHSIAFAGVVTRAELEEHLLTLRDKPDSIPYGTTYYKKNWGFSLTHNQYVTLKDDEYFVEIDVDEEPGKLNIFELVLPGKSSKEIFISTYLCHPSMANNELSGPSVFTALIRMLERKELQYTYRFVLAPETIGPIFYLSKNQKLLKRNTFAAFNLTCVGAGDEWSLLHSPDGKSYADKVSETILNEKVASFKKYDFLDRGSDERQYCSPTIDLPMVSIMRSKYQNFNEYHNSKDDLSYVTPERLQKTLDIYSSLFCFIEADGFFLNSSKGEPFLDKKLHYPKVGGQTQPGVRDFFTNIRNFLAFAKNNTLLEIGSKIHVSSDELVEISRFCLENALISKKNF